MKRLLSLLLAALLLFSLANAIAEDEKITVELFYSPWATTPTNGVDPYEDFLEEKYGCDFILTPATDFESQLYSRAAGGDMPDLILFGNYSQLITAYNQGILVDDWTPYLEEMPVTSANMNDLERSYLNVDGKIIACPSYPGSQVWTFCVRKDWMDKLGLEMPTSDDEFLEMLRAFTFDDPDGNGVDDTYGITSAGGNSTGELAHLINFYSPSGFYITEDKNVSHPIITDAYLDYLKLARTIVSEGYIDPNWYTQGWDERKPSLYAGDYGVCWYPPVALLNENASAVDEAEVLARWDVMPLYSGKYDAESFLGAMRSVSAAAAADEEKMNIITSYIEDCAYPNEQFFVVREGYLIDGYDIFLEIAPETYYLGMSSPDNHRERDYGSIMYGWGQMVQSAATEVKYYFGNTPEPTDLVKAEAAFISQISEMEKYGGESQLLTPDPTLVADSNALISEFEIDFILGNKTEDDWEAFKAEWLELYGQALLDDAIATYQAYGLID